METDFYIRGNGSMNVVTALTLEAELWIKNERIPEYMMVSDRAFACNNIMIGGLTDLMGDANLRIRRAN